MRTHAGWLGLFLVGTAACGESSGGGAVTPAPQPQGSGQGSGETNGTPPRAICPSCTREVAGSETSDFSGSSDPCSGDPAPAPDDPEWSARLAEVRAVYSGPFEASLRWSESSLVELESPSAFWRARPSGYEPATRLSAEIVLGESQFFEGRPTFPDSNQGLACPDWFEVPASVELATADGALAGTAQGSFRVGSGPSYLNAHLDLADAVGTLDLHLDPDLEYRADAQLSFTFHPEGKRGQISLSVMPVERSREREVGYWPLSMEFPNGSCGASGFPRTADVPLAWHGQQTATEVLATWNTEVQRLAVPAERHDCAPAGAREDQLVQLSFAVDAPESEICDRPAWPAARVPGGFSFRGAAWLRTSDGRLDVPLVGGSVTTDGLSLFSDESRTVGANHGAGLIPVTELAERAGIRGVHPGNASALGYLATVYFSRVGDVVQPSGTFWVEGSDCGDDHCYVLIHSDMSWPMDESTSFPLCNLGTIDL